MVAACGISRCKNVKNNFVIFCGICVLSLKCLVLSRFVTGCVECRGGRVWVFMVDEIITCTRNKIASKTKNVFSVSVGLSYIRLLIVNGWDMGFYLHVGINYRPFTRAVQKVSGHFEYLENRSRDLDVTWQPVRGDLTAHP